MAVSVEQAAVNAFRTYLAGQLVGGVTIFAHWPDAEPVLPAKAVAVTLAGAREDTLYDPQLVSSSKPTPTTAEAIYAVACVEQPVQLDVWALRHVDRDDVVAQIDRALRAGLGASLGLVGVDPVRQGVLVAMGDGWTGHADFLFDGPLLLDSPRSAREHEYRASWRGWARTTLTVTATSPRMATIKIRSRLREGDTAAGLYDVATVTSSGTTHTSEP